MTDPVIFEIDSSYRPHFPCPSSELLIANSHSYGIMEVNPKVLEWLLEHMGSRAYNVRFPGWRWMIREHTLNKQYELCHKFIFNYPSDAVLFKITWM